MLFKYSSKGQVSSCINEENVKINFDSVSRGIKYQQAKKTKKHVIAPVPVALPLVQYVLLK